MISSKLELIPTVIIAHRGDGNHLEASFFDLKPWFKNIVVVGPENLYLTKIIKDNGGLWVASASAQIRKLWEEGIKSTQSDWYLLMQNTEYLSTVLKESVAETVDMSKTTPSFYAFRRKTLFLKKDLNTT